MTLAHDLWFVVGGLLLPALRSSTPILLAILGETLTQRVGVVNLGVEGQMLVGAVAGFALASHGLNPWLALGFGACVGMLLSSLHALMVLLSRHRRSRAVRAHSGTRRAGLEPHSRAATRRRCNHHRQARQGQFLRDRPGTDPAHLRHHAPDFDRDHHRRLRAHDDARSQRSRF
jgi:hypothetical protein